MLQPLICCRITPPAPPTRSLLAWAAPPMEQPLPPALGELAGPWARPPPTVTLWDTNLSSPCLCSTHLCSLLPGSAPAEHVTSVTGQSHRHHGLCPAPRTGRKGLQNCPDSNDKTQYLGLLVASPYGCVPRRPTPKPTLLVMEHSDGSHTRPKLFPGLLPIPPLPPHLTSSQGAQRHQESESQLFLGQEPL